MEYKLTIEDQIIEIIEGQIENNDLPETNITFKRLTREGLSESDAKNLIAKCLVFELFDVLGNDKTLNRKRLIKNFNKLPNDPFYEKKRIQMIKKCWTSFTTACFNTNKKK